MHPLPWTLLAACTAAPDIAPEEQQPLARSAGVTETPWRPADASGEDPVDYVLSAPEGAHHLLDVHASVPTGGAAEVTLFQPTWTPGSYLVREYSRNVEGVSATGPDGALAVVKQAKNRWTVQTQGAERVDVSWRVYCREPTVRTCYVDPDKWVISPASALLTSLETTGHPHRLRLDTPADFAPAELPLEQRDGRWWASDFDVLVDSPIVVARDVVVRRFDLEGIPHAQVLVDTDGTWDVDWAAEASEGVVRAARSLFFELPYAQYHFFTVVHPGGRGGLEHLASTLVYSEVYRTSDEAGRQGLMSLWLHELLHAVNGKRLRPAPLGPFDYEQEAYTPSLWVVEGITSYYADLLLTRTEQLPVEDYLRTLGDKLATLHTTPGRFVQPLSQSSFDAWIELYRRDEHSPNQAMGYYVRGAVVAWLLDVELRRRTDGAVTLDHFMREAAARYSGEHGYTPEDLVELASSLAGSEMAPFFAAHVDGTEDADVDGALAWLGLERGGDAPPKGAWLGAKTQDKAGRLVITEVRRDTPAWEAGLTVDDELIAIDGRRLGSLDTSLGRLAPDAKVSLTLSRHGKLVSLPATLGTPPDPDAWKLRLAQGIDEATRARRDAWLGVSTDADAATETPAP